MPSTRTACWGSSPLCLQRPSCWQAAVLKEDRPPHPHDTNLDHVSQSVSLPGDTLLPFSDPWSSPSTPGEPHPKLFILSLLLSAHRVSVFLSPSRLPSSTTKGRRTRLVRGGECRGGARAGLGAGLGGRAGACPVTAERAAGAPGLLRQQVTAHPRPLVECSALVPAPARPMFLPTTCPAQLPSVSPCSLSHCLS